MVASRNKGILGTRKHMQAAKIHIARSNDGWVDRARAYDVVVNGEHRGKLRRGEYTEIDVEPGEQSVYLKIDWCRSRVLEFNLQEGAKAQLRCWPRGPLSALYGITIGRNNYMRLESA
jgi:hypothetical protein